MKWLLLSMFMALPVYGDEASIYYGMKSYHTIPKLCSTCRPFHNNNDVRCVRLGRTSFCQWNSSVLGNKVQAATYEVGRFKDVSLHVGISHGYHAFGTTLEQEEDYRAAYNPHAHLEFDILNTKPVGLTLATTLIAVNLGVKVSFDLK